MHLRSPTFEDHGYLPPKYAGNGDDVSPPLQWDEVPDGTQSFTLVVDDPDSDNVRVHWVLYGLPEDWRELPEHFAPEERRPERDVQDYRVKQGRNDFGTIGYRGPRPTRDRPHHYAFTLYALDCDLHLPPGAAKEDVLAAMHDHVLDHAALVGLYNE